MNMYDEEPSTVTPFQFYTIWFNHLACSFEYILFYYSSLIFTSLALQRSVHSWLTLLVPPTQSSLAIDIEPMLGQCSATVCDATTTLNKHWLIISCCVAVRGGCN